MRKPSPLSSICGWSGCLSLFSGSSDHLFCWPRKASACCKLVRVFPGWKLLHLLYFEIEVKEGKEPLPKIDLNNPGNSADLKFETGKFLLPVSLMEIINGVSALVPILLPREI